MIRLLLACAEPSSPGDAPEGSPPDPATVFLQLADALATGLYPALHFTVGEAVLTDLAVDDARTIDFVLPDDAAPGRWTLDGEGLVDGWVYRWKSSTWEWSASLHAWRLALPAADVSVEGAWAANLVRYDAPVVEQFFMGTLAIDGADPVEVSLDTTGTWSTVGRARGWMDGVYLEWDNPDPDVP